LALTRFVFLQVVDEEIFKRRVLVVGRRGARSTIAERLRRRTDQRGFKIVGYVRAPGDGPTLRRASFCSTTEICFAWRCAISGGDRGRNG